MPVDRIPKEEEPVISLYSEEELATVATEDKAGFIRTMFRALGLKKITPAAPKESQKVSKAKRRRKLFSSQDEQLVTKEEDDVNK